MSLILPRNGAGLLRRTIGAAAGGTDWTDLISYLRMDESSGTRADQLSAVSLAEVGGTISSGTGLVYGTATTFLKTDARYLRDNGGAAEWNNTNQFTVCMWVKPVTLTDFDGFFTSDNSNTYELLYRDSTRVRWAVAGNSQDYSYTLTTGNWFFLVAGYDSAADKMFVSINGAAKTEVTNTANKNNYATTIVLGKSAAAVFCDSLIGPVAHFAAYLSDARISDLYNAGAGRVYP